MKKDVPTIALTPGEPAGIGPDLAIGLIQSSQSGNPPYRLVLVADPELLRQRARRLGINADLPLWSPDTHTPVSVLPVHTMVAVTPGILDKNNSAYVIDTLKQSVDGCKKGIFNALVTGPVHKGIINEAGLAFTGHTEFLAGLCDVSDVVMMLVTETAGVSVRVGLVTTHLPLAEVSAAVTPTRLEQTLLILDRELRNKFGLKKPRILVCGLNPHAGESGYLGREEIDTIGPVVQHLANQGLNLCGPLPADTVFTPPMLRKADAVLTMYHDQGLPVLKHIGFGRAVNITLGLPFIRTSVDHGTALERAGTDTIDSGSLDAAMTLACRLAAK